jgi:hypothetical protein
VVVKAVCLSCRLCRPDCLRRILRTRYCLIQNLFYKPRVSEQLMEALRFFRYARNEKMAILNSCKSITDLSIEQSVSVMDVISNNNTVV